VKTEDKKCKTMGSSRVSILVFDQKADLEKPIIGFFFLSEEDKRWVSILGFELSKMGKRKNLLDERHVGANRRGERSSTFLLKKTRILVKM